MIIEYGPPTFWLALSPGDYDDEELFEYLKKMNKDLPDLDKMNLSQLICKDPVLAGQSSTRSLKQFTTSYALIYNHSARLYSYTRLRENGVPVTPDGAHALPVLDQGCPDNRCQHSSRSTRLYR